MQIAITLEGVSDQEDPPLPLEALGKLLSTAKLETLGRQSPNASRKHRSAFVNMLTDSLEGSKYLRILDLSHNGLTDKDLGNLSQVLSTCQLENQNLGNNNISDQGLAVLASLSIPGGSLQTLDITRNQGCTQEGFCHLLKLVKDNPRLDSLHCQFEEGLSPETRHFLAFNKSGRSLLGQAGHNFPLSLWPVVLERANGIFHDEADHKEKVANVIFHLLQGP
jgi:hypothetical protein